VGCLVSYFRRIMIKESENIPDVQQLHVRTPPGSADCRLDKVLSGLLPQYSRATLQRWLRSGLVTVNGKAMAVRDQVLPDTVVDIICQPEVIREWVAQDLELNIIAEDDSLLVVNKPAGLVVHPGAGNPDHTLVNALLWYDPGLASLPRAGIVHRLDKDTSGLLVVARTESARLQLIEQLRTHAVYRQYDAIVCGHPCQRGTIDTLLGRSPHDRIRMAVTRGGKKAVTHYRVQEQFRAHSHVAVRLETGRTHQIRVHMRHIGFPLVGDPVYGGRVRVVPHMDQTLAHKLRIFGRQALHATTLSLVHPETAKNVRWQIPLPDDMQMLLQALQSDTAHMGDPEFRRPEFRPN